MKESFDILPLLIERDLFRTYHNILIQVSLVRSTREFGEAIKEETKNKWVCSLELILVKTSFVRDYDYFNEKTIYFDTYEECLKDGIRLAHKIINK